MTTDPVELLWKRTEKEPFRAKMGIRILEIEPGLARCAMDFSPDLANIYGKLHGGAVFSLLDEAFQLACNAHGQIAVALQLSVNFLAPAEPGVRLIAEAREINATRKTALYQAEVTQADGKKLATGQALAYRLGRPLPFDQDGKLTEG